MSLGGIFGKLMGGLAGQFVGSALGGAGIGIGGERERVRKQPFITSVSRRTPKPKPGKAGRLALIKTKRTGVFDESSTSGRGKLFGN